MTRMKVPTSSIFHVFFQWLFIGPFVNWDPDPWMKGLIIAELGMIPIMVLHWFRNKKRILSTAVFAAILGSMIGFLADQLIN